MRPTIKGLQEEIRKLTEEKNKLKEDKAIYATIVLIVFGAIILYSLYAGATWLKDTAIPQGAERFGKWYGESDFNRGFWSGTINAGLFVSVVLGIKWIFSRRWYLSI